MDKLIYSEDGKSATMPTLFKQNGTKSKTLIWDIETTLFEKAVRHGKNKQKRLNTTDLSECFSIVTAKHGQKDGKIQEAPVKVEAGKNIGKKNETNVLTQALANMVSAWTKQKDRKGYTETIEESKTVLIRPMLLNKYEDRVTKIKFPVYVQPKLDGIRAFTHYDPTTKSIRFFSRTGNEFFHMDHIRADLMRCKDLVNNPNVWLDGELFTTEVPFEDIVSVVKKGLEKTANSNESSLEAEKQVKLHVYDMYDTEAPTLPFASRYSHYKTMIETIPNSTAVVAVLSETCKDDAQVQTKFKEYEARYEGLVARVLTGVYELGKRSNNVLKLKSFDLTEYEIVNFTQGKGKEEGLIIFIVKTPEGEVTVVPKATAEQRREMFAKASSFIGKPLTVRHFRLTADGLPRIAKGIIRDYE